MLVGVSVFARLEMRANLAAGAAGVACGALAAVIATLPPTPDDVARLAGHGLVAVEGAVVQSDASAARAVLVVAADRVRSRGRTSTASGLVGVTLAHHGRDWRVGMRVRFVGALRRPRNFANPGAYDHAGALARRGIRATLFLWNDDRLTALDDGPPTAGAAVARWRATVAERIARDTREPARGYLTAVLLGAATSIDDLTYQALVRTGLVHVVSVSGFHVAVAAGACFLLLRWLFARSEGLALRFDVTKLASVVAVAPVLTYAAIAGGSVPATRSFLSYAAVVAAVACDRPPDALRALALAAIVIAASVPAVAADVSFELSFVSVVALILLGRRQRRSRSVAPSRVPERIRTFLVEPLVVSSVATLATAPLTAWHFQQVSLIAPLANLVCLPLLGPATLLPGLAALPATLIAPPVADLLLGVAGRAAAAGLSLADALARPAWAATATPMPSLLELALCYAALGLWWVRSAAAERSLLPVHRIAVAIVAACALADVGAWTWERYCDPTLRVTFVSIGQGDAAVLELPRGGVMVIDGGGCPGDFDVGERVLAPFLRARKILHVDVVALSHPQLDHYGGLTYVAAHFAPREFWSNGLAATSAGFVALEHALDDAGARRVVLRRGMVRDLGPEVAVDVLHPEHPSGADLNDGSLVLRVRFRRTAVLFTGDIERDAERDLLVAESAALRSDVLKVPHHGSATSSTAAWLAAIAPRVAVVSSGADNRFGFPAPSVVRRLRDVGAEVWNTADDGAVRVVSDGVEVHASATRARRQRFEFPELLW